MVIETILLATLIFALLLYFYIFARPKFFPPGPIPFPIIGSIHLLGTQPQKALKDLSRKYGDVFSIFLGGWKVVVINNIDAAKESLIEKGADFAGRAPLYTGIEAARGKKTGYGIDIIFSPYGDYWYTIRKIAHKALKMYGANRGELQKTTEIHSGELIERLQSRDGEAFDPKNDLCLATTNIICTIVFGSKYDIKDEEFGTIIYYNKILVEGLAGASGVDFMTWLRHFPNKNINLIREAAKLRDPILEKWLAKHEETFQPGKIRDFTDALIDAANEEASLDESSKRYLERDNIIMIMSDVFSAGIETTSTTMRWFIAYSVLWPEKQKKIHEELDRVIGRSKTPTMDDRPNLPYFEAAINETARLASVISLLIRMTTCNTSAAGFKIPKNTHVFYNTYAIHHDERQWGDPEQFRPERWLDAEGKYTPGAHSSFLPFAAGRRACFGEALAKMELFLILSRIFQNFEFVQAPGEQLPKVDGNVFLTHDPKPYKVSAKNRF